MSTLDRRHFLQTAAAACCAAGDVALSPAGAAGLEPRRTMALDNALWLGRRLVEWQGAAGGPDPKKCPYRSPGPFTAYHLHGAGPSCRALYRLYDETRMPEFKFAADRYAIFVMNSVHDRAGADGDGLRIEIDGKPRVTLSSAWMFGKALAPCYEEFVRHNPGEDCCELKAHAMYRWLQRHRNSDSHFGVGYPNGKFPDAQFTCDLGEVGTGLVGFYNASKHLPALDDAIGLAKFFLTDYEPGSGRGAWSPKPGVWLVGPWPGGGAEHFNGQVYNETGWGWSCLVDAEFLLGLRTLVDDAALRSAIAEKCIKAWQWCLDTCQFDDGACGMFARDDKWAGMTVVPVRLYALLREQNLIPPAIGPAYRAKIDKAWQWLLAHTSPETFPEDGYEKVTGRTTKKPLENLVWLMAWTIEALLDGARSIGA